MYAFFSDPCGGSCCGCINVVSADAAAAAANVRDTTTTAIMTDVVVAVDVMTGILLVLLRRPFFLCI